MKRGRAVSEHRLRGLPAVERLAAEASRRGNAAPGVARAAARAVLNEARQRVLVDEAVPGLDQLVERTDAVIESWLQPGPARVINATGVIIHTNLGRAPLSEPARTAMQQAAGYCSLDYDTVNGTRSSRQDHLRPLLRAVSGAEDGMAVTNNAAALFLVLRVLCHRRDVLVSRGEAVAIGDGFRIPSIMSAAGARLVDVGTTNRTTASDYEEAITPRTAAIMRVHTSNFAVSGFTERPVDVECVAVARSNGILLIEDVGSGCLQRLGEGVIAGDSEPVVRESVANGVDVVTCSADKLCGGPQAGLIFTSTALTAKLRRHPVARVLRPDKLVVAALGATLSSFARGAADEEIPVLRMLRMGLPEIEMRARAWLNALLTHGVPASLESAESTVGGGSLPSSVLPTVCLTVPDPRGAFARRLGYHRPPLVGRLARGRLWLDPRTVGPDDDTVVVDALATAWTDPTVAT